ncbi:MAG: hypothetical protein ABWX82_13370 [Leifsonia sp.]
MTDAYRSDASASGGGATGTTEAVRDEAGNIRDTAVDAGRTVAATAKDEAAGVVEEAKVQVSTLFSQVRDELRDQAATQQTRAAAGLRSIGDELNEMSRASSGGIAADLVSQASSRAGSVASWLEGHDPASLIDEVRNFARRRPGTFIAIAAGVGLLAGRITRSAASNAHDSAGSAKPADAVTSAPRTDQIDASASTGATATPLYSALAADEQGTPTFDDVAYGDEAAAFGDDSSKEFGAGNAQRPYGDDR